MTRTSILSGILGVIILLPAPVQGAQVRSGEVALHGLLGALVEAWTETITEASKHFADGAGFSGKELEVVNFPQPIQPLWCKRVSVAPLTALGHLRVGFAYSRPQNTPPTEFPGCRIKDRGKWEASGRCLLIL